jgi:short-subunit dehydrogenase
MKILLTGSSSGLGEELYSILATHHEVHAPKRDTLDLADPTSVLNYPDLSYDVLINCAGTDIGGKIDFINHQPKFVENILQTNFVSPVLLTQKILKNNLNCKIVNITSTNNNRYWPNDLAYSLSKKSLEIFGQMLLVEYPTVPYLEVRLGLTKTNFNHNRYTNDQDRFFDVYLNKHLTSTEVAEKIVDILFDNSVKYIEISP